MSDKRVLATVSVRRNARGLQLTVSAPEIAHWMQDDREYSSAESLGCHIRGTWPLTGITSAEGLPGELCNYGAAFNNGVNLSILRHKDALLGPVSCTFKGLFTFEQAKSFLVACQSWLPPTYRDYIRPFEGEAVVTVNGEVTKKTPVISE